MSLRTSTLLPRHMWQMQFFGMQEKPTKHGWPYLLSMTQSAESHWQYLSNTIGIFMDEYVMPSLLFSLSPSTKTSGKSDASSHGIHNYSCSFMADLLLVEKFKDAVGEGDGEWMLIIWKLLLLHFGANGHTNYAAEGVWLIAEASAVLTESGVYRLKWCRYINTKEECSVWPWNGTLEPCIQTALGHCLRERLFFNYHPHWTGPLNTEPGNWQLW